jgi:hypothetical protein
MNDDQYFLANAYLDGELTDAERAIAEADPEVMSEVEQLRALQADVRAVDPPSEAAREAAIAAAMTQFTPATATPSPATAPVARTMVFRPRPWYRRSLAIAAAVVAVGVLGVVVVNVSRSDDTDDSADFATAVEDADEADDDGADAPASGADAGDAEDGADTRDLVEPEAAAEIASDAAAAPLATTETFHAADDVAAAGDDSGGDGDAAVTELPPGAILIVPTADPVDPALVPDPAELGRVGADLLGLFDQQQLPPTPNTNCFFPDAVDPSMILGRELFEVESGVVELLIYGDTSNGVVYGVHPDTCEILVVGPLP